jgi:hypothetical protein
VRDEAVKAPTHNAHHADQESGLFHCIAVPMVRAHFNFSLEDTTMFYTRHLIQSALVAAAVAATAPVYADASFATGGYARFAPAQIVEGSPVPAAPSFSFATGGFARQAAEGSVAPISEPTPAVVNRQPSFATGGYARDVLGNAANVIEHGTLRIAGYPWDKDGYRSDGWRAPADALIVAGYPWDNGGYKSDGWRVPERQG